MTVPPTGSNRPPGGPSPAGSPSSEPALKGRGSQHLLAIVILALISVALVVAVIALFSDRDRLFTENTALREQTEALTRERTDLQAQVAQLQERVILLETAEAARLAAIEETTRSRINSLIDSLQRFRLAERRYPAALADLNRRDAAGRPYRDPEVPLIDGWNREFRYLVTAAADRAVLASAGPDQEFNTEDDLFAQFPAPARVEIGSTPQP